MTRRGVCFQEISPSALNDLIGVTTKRQQLHYMRINAYLGQFDLHLHSGPDLHTFTTEVIKTGTLTAEDQTAHCCPTLSLLYQLQLLCLMSNTHTRKCQMQVTDGGCLIWLVVGGWGGVAAVGDEPFVHRLQFLCGSFFDLLSLWFHLHLFIHQTFWCWSIKPRMV